MEIVNYIDRATLTASIFAMELDSIMFVSNVPNDVYHIVSGWSSTHGKVAYQSEQRLHRYLTKADDGPKDHFVFGELVHDSVRLNESEIEFLYCSDVAMPHGSTNAAKAIKYCIANNTKDIDAAGLNIKPGDRAGAQEIVDQIAGRQIVSKTAVTEARQLADLLKSELTVQGALEKNQVLYELSVWRKGKDGFVRKCRPDCIVPELKTIFDWKTTRDIVWTYDTGDRHQFVKRALDREVDKRDYGFSAGWYLSIFDWIEDGAFMDVFADKDAMEVYPAYLFSVDRMVQEQRRCVEACKAIRSYTGKIADGKVIEPLTTFLPNDGFIFTGQSKEFG